MRDVELRLPCASDTPKEKLIEIFTKEIDDFSKWLETKTAVMQQGALTRPERILLLTYFMQKYAGNLDKE